jgi:hypothetical protein
MRNISHTSPAPPNVIRAWYHADPPYLVLALSLASQTANLIVSAPTLPHVVLLRTVMGPESSPLTKVEAILTNLSERITKEPERDKSIEILGPGLTMTPVASCSGLQLLKG